MSKKFKKETIASKAGIGKDIQHGAGGFVHHSLLFILEQTLSMRRFWQFLKNRAPMNIQDREIQLEIH